MIGSRGDSIPPLIHFEAAEPPEITLGCEELIVLDNVANIHAVRPHGAYACKNRGVNTSPQRLAQIICQRFIGIHRCGIWLF